MRSRGAKAGALARSPAGVAAGGASPLDPPRTLSKPVCVVGIGASSGGIEALSELLTTLPPDTGMAFVIVAPGTPVPLGGLVELLRRATTMPVSLAEHDA